MLHVARVYALTVISKGASSNKIHAGLENTLNSLKKKVTSPRSSFKFAPSGRTVDKLAIKLKSGRWLLVQVACDPDNLLNESALVDVLPSDVGSTKYIENLSDCCEERYCCDDELRAHVFPAINTVPFTCFESYDGDGEETPTSWTTALGAVHLGRHGRDE